jgi:hypothetical protein
LGQKEKGIGRGNILDLTGLSVDNPHGLVDNTYAGGVAHGVEQTPACKKEL